MAQGNQKPQDSLGLSWCDTAWLNMLNPTNVLNYFAERSNPFYEHTCNNEMLRMRGIRMDSMVELEKMIGVEYVLLHVQEPILYVIRKQKRHSPTSTTTIANYYIIAGSVYEAPDLQSIITSKMLTSIHSLQSAFDECFKAARFHPSTNYYWNFKDGSIGNLDVKVEDKKDSVKSGVKEEVGSSTNTVGKKKEISITEASDAARQMYRVDLLMRELVKKFPPKLQPPPGTAAVNGQTNGHSEGGPQLDNNNQTDQFMDTGVNGPGSDSMTNGVDETKSAKQQSMINSNNNLTPPAKKPKLG